MSDQVLQMLFVSPTGNTLPTTGSTQNLTPAQLGIFLPDNTPATVTNVGSAKYIYFAQGRNVYAPGEGSRKSDKIFPSNLIRWYWTSGNLQQNVQVTEISNLNIGCQEDVSITLRLGEMYISAAYNNYLTRTVMVTTPCCNCGANPCDTLSDADIEATMQQLAQNINDDDILSLYVTAGTQGTGATTKIIISGNTLQTYGQGTSADPTNYPYQFDRMYFWTYLMSGPVLTTDYEIPDICNEVGDIAILQRAAYPRNTPVEVKQLEKDYFGYDNVFKDIYADSDYNGEYSTYVDSALAYDLYYLNFFQPLLSPGEVGITRQDEWVVWAVPKGDASEAGTLAILSVLLGTPENSTATPVSTSTYTTSSTTSTTTTNNTTP